MTNFYNLPIVQDARLLLEDMYFDMLDEYGVEYFVEDGRDMLIKDEYLELQSDDMAEELGYKDFISFIIDRAYDKPAFKEWTDLRLREIKLNTDQYALAREAD